jgi:hypothetical protein
MEVVLKIRGVRGVINTIELKPLFNEEPSHRAIFLSDISTVD